MTDRTWQRAQELYHPAMDRPTGERAAFVAAACGDADLLRAVESLLAHEATPVTIR